MYREGDTRNPTLLNPCRSKKFDKEGCYIWDPKIQQVRWQGMFLIFLVLGIIAACCFPIWPISAKLGVWYVSVVLLCIIMGTTIIRYIVYILFFIIGYDFWLIPNMYDDKAGFWETFTPFYFFRKRNDSGFQIGIRVSTFITVLGCIVYTYLHPEVIEAIQEISFGGIQELVMWGENKILSVSFI
jgi:translocation protein SEC62